MAVTQAGKEKVRRLLLSVENDSDFHRKFTSKALSTYAHVRRHVLYETCVKLDKPGASGLGAELLEQMVRHLVDVWGMTPSVYMKDDVWEGLKTQNLYTDETVSTRSTKSAGPNMQQIPKAPLKIKRFNLIDDKRLMSLYHGMNKVNCQIELRQKLENAIRCNVSGTMCMHWLSENTDVPEEDREGLAQMLLNLCGKWDLPPPPMGDMAYLPYINIGTTSVDLYNKMMMKLQAKDRPSTWAKPFHLKELDDREEFLRLHLNTHRFDTTKCGEMSINLPPFEMVSCTVQVGEAAIPQSLEKENTMSNTAIIKITTKTLVNGVDAAGMSNDALYAIIADQEKEIERLDTIKNKPKALKQELADRQAGIQSLVDLIDARDAK